METETGKGGHTSVIHQLEAKGEFGDFTNSNVGVDMDEGELRVSYLFILDSKSMKLEPLYVCVCVCVSVNER